MHPAAVYSCDVTYFIEPCNFARKLSARQVTERPLQPQRPRSRKATNKLGILEDFVNPPVYDDVSDVGRVAPLPHVGRAGLLEVPARGLDFDLGRAKTAEGAALSRLVVTHGVA